jgi:membrane peptidoglycan carboxypeptidase
VFCRWYKRFRQDKARLLLVMATLKEQLSEVESKYCMDRLVVAFICAEDHRFLRHKGVDWIGVVRAIAVFLSTGDVQGASTLQQQFVRVMTGRYERTISRKISEIILARSLYGYVDRSQIAKMYALVAYYGSQMNGLAQALHHLGLKDGEISQEAAIILSARLKYPQPTSPRSDWVKKISSRERHIRRLMRSESFLKFPDRIPNILMSSLRLLGII